ncbi:hypothetical protein [Sphingomonas sp.]|jgi:tetratricopeptide (TPR) repeat protein|uniref:tetratricopeptide repeat protein n=1 Tax=Sphingomonas sp. TaxID=28214 RepID=UPI002ED84AA6
MGWLWLLLLAAVAMGMLALLGVNRRLWSFAGAALMLGGAGYALQGSPALVGRTAVAGAAAVPDDPAMIALRDDMYDRFTLDGAYLIASDAMIARGDDRSAVRVLLGGIGKIPRSAALWTALGSAYARHDGGQVSPAARFAFEQARRLAPTSPAPPFFQGLAHVREGDLAAARPLWARALALSPPKRSYRQGIALRLAILDRLIEMQKAGQDAGPPPR